MFRVRFGKIRFPSLTGWSGPLRNRFRGLRVKLRGNSAGCLQILAIVAIAFAAVAFSSLFAPEQRPKDIASSAVRETITVSLILPSAAPYSREIRVTGVIEAEATIPIAPQVGGRILTVSSNFASGEEVQANAVLATIDRSDLELQRRAALGEITAAQADLSQLEALGEFNSRYWQKMYPKREVPPLVARIPQIEAARGRLISATATREQADLALSRTILRAPASGRILSTVAAPGRVVAANEALGEMYGFEAVEMVFALSEDQLSTLSPIEGRRVRIEERPDLPIIVDRVESQLDPQTRLANVRARVTSTSSVTIGEFLSGTISAPASENLFRLPTSAALDEQSAWIVKSGRAQRKKIVIRFRDAMYIYVDPFDFGDGIIADPSSRLANGDKVKSIASAAQIPNDPERRADQ